MAINATAVWRVRPSGSNTNGGGYDAGISGAATDYSQQNSAQASGTHGVTTGTTTFTDATAAAFTAAMIGNAIYISGSGQTTGFYFVTAFTSSSVVTLDRSPGTGVSATWALGGGWADFWTNVGYSGGPSTPVVPGNTIYILGSGTPNPSSYSYDYPALPINGAINISGNTTAGCVTFANDPSTPGYKAPPDTTGGMPLCRTSATSFPTLFNGGNSFIRWQGIWLVSALAGNNALLYNCVVVVVFGCVFDQVSYGGSVTGTCQAVAHIGSEYFSSTGGSPNAGTLLEVNFGGAVLGCNIHDCLTGTISVTNEGVVSNNIIAKNQGDGISLHSSAQQLATIMNNTIDGNSGNGINIIDQASCSNSVILNNIISNHTGGGQYGLTIGAGTATQNAAIAPLIDYNVYYNNTSNYNAISAGPHDTALGVTPYVASSTENYTLA
jgi:hypothetical protein